MTPVSSSSFSRYAFLRASITAAFSWLLRLFRLTPSSFFRISSAFFRTSTSNCSRWRVFSNSLFSRRRDSTASTSAAFSARNASNAASLSGSSGFFISSVHSPANSFSRQKYRVEWLTPYLFAIFSAPPPLAQNSTTA